MIPTTPYLIRAIHDWCSDQGFTPYLLVDASVAGVEVPRHLVENNAIVLNIQASAVRDLELGNDWILFNARFSGQAMNISIPVSAVRAIYARENGQGCAFEVAGPPRDETDGGLADEASSRTQEPPKPGKQGKPNLKLV